MKIAIVGAAGRMGKMLCRLAEGTSLEVVSKVDVAEGYDREWSGDVEGVIDFSHHSVLPGAIAKAAEQGIAYVIGTTGITAEEQAVLVERFQTYWDEAAAQHGFEDLLAKAIEIRG